jgi:hypothetical protein
MEMALYGALMIHFPLLACCTQHLTLFALTDDDFSKQVKQEMQHIAAGGCGTSDEPVSAVHSNRRHACMHACSAAAACAHAVRGGVA